MLIYDPPPELGDRELTEQTPTLISAGHWLQQWPSSLTMACSHMVPLTASSVHTPLRASTWHSMLVSHPDRSLVLFMLNGICKGFRIGFTKSSSSLKAARSNLEGAREHPDIVTDYLSTEISLGRVAGPFPLKAIPQVHISRFGVIPKGQTGKWRLIVDLSHPKGHSVNDGIPKALCSLKYITIDEAIKEIVQLGQGALLAKIDIKSAFRLLPVHPADRFMLGMRWNEGVYIDTCLPFGLRSSPKLFNILAEFLAWIAKQSGVSFLIHYLDDFLTMGPPSTLTCQHNLDTTIRICNHLGVPLALEKVEGPATTLPFLGIVLDTIRMEARLPEDKLKKLREEVSKWLDCNHARKHEILSLVGSLQHATKVVRCGRAFVSRMYATAAKVKEMHFHTRLNLEFRLDFCWWHTFLTDWNGLSLLRWDDSSWTPNHVIQTDALGAYGCGSFWEGQWLQWCWPPEWAQDNIMVKELVPIVLSCAVWGKQLAGGRVLIECDNSSVVAAVNKHYAREQKVMHLLRSLWFFVAHFDIDVKCKHIAGVNNSTADYLSRGNLHSFFHLHPQAAQQPTPLPPPLLQILATGGPDWTSPLFRQLFTTTLEMV